jgi:hypothetical protein
MTRIQSQILIEEILSSNDKNRNANHSRINPNKGVPSFDILGAITAPYTRRCPARPRHTQRAFTQHDGFVLPSQCFVNEKREPQRRSAGRVFFPFYHELDSLHQIQLGSTSPHHRGSLCLLVEPNATTPIRVKIAPTLGR